MESKFKGMTVNERLYVSGLMDDFDKAVEKKDLNKIKEILYKVDLVDESINPILESFGLNEKNIKLGKVGISGLKLDNSTIKGVSINKTSLNNVDVGIFDSEIKDSKISDTTISDGKVCEEHHKLKNKTFLKSIGFFFFDNIVKIIVGILIAIVCIMLGLKK